EEIERVSDHIAMLHEGRLVLCGPLDEIKGEYRKLLFRFDAPQVSRPSFPGALSIRGTGREWAVISKNPFVGNVGARLVEDEAASLNDIFVAIASAPVDSPAVEVASHA